MTRRKRGTLTPPENLSMNNRSIPRAPRFPVTRLALLVSLNSLCLISPFIQADDEVPTSATVPASDYSAAMTLGTVSVIGQGETRCAARDAKG